MITHRTATPKKPENFWLLFLLPLAVSCNSGSGPVTDAESPMDTLSGNFHDQVSAGETNNRTAFLAGQVYLFAPELDTTTCTVSGACDCCLSNVLFLNDTEFIVVNYCGADDYVSQGTYRADGSTVYLHYDSLSVDKVYNWEAETSTAGTTPPEYSISTKKTETRTVALIAMACADEPVYRIDGEEVYYGVADRDNPLNLHIGRLRESGVLEKLRK
jgi:hypothetical protein